MSECRIRGCRTLEWKCKECGRVCVTSDMTHIDWIRTEDSVPTPMKNVFLCIGDEHVIIGWNETTEPGEDAAYCSWEPWHHWPESYISGEGVTAWAYFPKAPKRKE